MLPVAGRCRGGDAAPLAAWWRGFSCRQAAFRHSPRPGHPHRSRGSRAAGAAGEVGSAWLWERETCRSSPSGMNRQGHACRGRHGWACRDVKGSEGFGNARREGALQAKNPKPQLSSGENNERLRPRLGKASVLRKACNLMLAFKPHWCQISVVLRNGRFKHILRSFLDSWPRTEAAGQSGCKLRAWVFSTWSQPQQSRADPAQSQLWVLMYNCKQFPSRLRKAEQGPCLLYRSYFYPWRQAARVRFQPGGCLGQWRKGTRVRVRRPARPVIVSGYYSLTRNVNEVP